MARCVPCHGACLPVSDEVSSENLTFLGCSCWWCRNQANNHQVLPVVTSGVFFATFETGVKGLNSDVTDPDQSKVTNGRTWQVRLLVYPIIYLDLLKKMLLKQVPNRFTQNGGEKWWFSSHGFNQSVKGLIDLRWRTRAFNMSNWCHDPNSVRPTIHVLSCIVMSHQSHSIPCYLKSNTN